jgi:dynactin complex subunit
MDYSELIKAIKAGECLSLPECALRRERELGIKRISIHQEMRDTTNERERTFLAQLTAEAVPARLGGSKLVITLAEQRRYPLDNRPLLFGHIYYRITDIGTENICYTSICSEQDLIQELVRRLEHSMKREQQAW